MKICMFIGTLRGGGAERVFVRLANSFVEAGHTVDLVLLSSDGNQYADDLSSGVRLIDLNVLQFWKAPLPLWLHLHRTKPDVLLSALSYINGIAAWTTRFMRNRPTVLLSERSASSSILRKAQTMRERIYAYVVRPSYRFADGIVAVSEGVAQCVSTIPGVRSDKVHVVYNPTWTPQIDIAAKEPVNHPWLDKAGPPVVLSVGRLSIEKDHVALIRAFDAVRKKREAKLIILGEGVLRPELEGLVKQLGLENDVALPGFARNPWAYMARATVFVLSSQGEGFPNALVEAMACGTPVVSTDCMSGPSEILDGGRFGPLVPVGDHEALASAIEQMIENPTPAETLRQRAQSFSVDASTASFLNLFETIQQTRLL